MKNYILSKNCMVKIYLVNVNLVSVDVYNYNQVILAGSQFVLRFFVFFFFN